MNVCSSISAGGVNAFGRQLRVTSIATRMTSDTVIGKSSGATPESACSMKVFQI